MDEFLLDAAGEQRLLDDFARIGDVLGDESRDVIGAKRRWSVVQSLMIG
jgi:hypothetical protein